MRFLDETAPSNQPWRPFANHMSRGGGSGGNKAVSEKIYNQKNIMALMTLYISIDNPFNAAGVTIQCNAVVELGERHLFISKRLASELSLTELGSRDVIDQNGEMKVLPYVGPIRVQFGSRQCFIGGLIMEGDVLLGTIAMDALNLAVHPITGEVVENPSASTLPTIFTTQA